LVESEVKRNGREEKYERARHKLNEAYGAGALGIAGIIGLAAESWTVFIVAAIVTLGLSVAGGSIRLSGRR
jgi:hypothetical protein